MPQARRKTLRVLRVALSSLRARRLRSLLLVGTVMLGVSILGGSTVYGETAKAAFFDDLARGAASVDIVGHPRDERVAATPPGGDPKLVAEIAALPGVAHVDQRLVAYLGLIGRGDRVITNAGEVGLGMAAPSWAGFAPYRLDGRLPQASGEAVIDAPTAAREAIHPGDAVTVVGSAGDRHRLVVVGLADFGVSDVYADTSVVILTSADLVELTGAHRGDIVVATEPGADAAAIRQQVATALGPQFDVTDGDTLRTAIATDSAKYVSSFLRTLRVTAIVALAVMLLVVYNAFQITVHQRAREHALLRALGAKRGQIVRLVTAEALLIGLAASAGSVVLSIGAGYALLVAQRYLGGGIPEFALTITPLAIAGPVVAGLVATLISALLPALAAGRVSPLEALQTASDPQPAAKRRRGGNHQARAPLNVPLAAVLTVAAALAAGAGGVALLNSGRGQGFDGLPAMAAGGMIIFAAGLLLLPLVITSLSAPVRIALGRVFGATGRIAVDNARRHPVRFAATTVALTVGIAPMTAFAILLTTAQTQAERELAENFPVDFEISHATGAASTDFPADVVARLRARPELNLVALSWVTAADPAVCCGRIGAVEDGVLGRQLALEVRDGQLTDLPVATVALGIGYASERGLHVGDTVEIGPEGKTRPVRVIAIYDSSPVLADAIINRADFVAAGLAGPQTLLVRRAAEVTAGSARTAVEAELADDPLAVVTSSAERRETLAASLGRRLIQFNVLLGLSMLIAVLGIANTLWLSVLERTRELGMMRALGLSRRQTYGSLLVEALLIALTGGAIGVAFGWGFGWVLANELVDRYGHGAPDIPVGLIAGYVAIGALAAMVASILPARRSARASITTAISSL